MLETAPQILWALALLGTALLAFWRGGPPEQVATTVVLLGYAASLVLSERREWHGPQWRMIVINGLVACGQTYVMIRSKRWWPIAVTAWSWLSFGMYLTVFIEPEIRARAYYSLGVLWDYLQLFGITIGVVLELRNNSQTTQRAVPRGAMNAR